MRSGGPSADMPVPRGPGFSNWSRLAGTYSRLGEEPRSTTRTRLAVISAGLLAVALATVAVRHCFVEGSGPAVMSRGGASALQQQSEQKEQAQTASSQHLRSGSSGQNTVTPTVAPAPEGPWHFLTDAAGAVSGAFGQAALSLHLVSTTYTTSTTTVTSTSTQTVTSTTTSTSTSSVTVTTTTSTTTKLTTLFCYMVVRKDGYEVPLVTQQYWKKASVFECEESQIYSNGGEVQIGDLTTIEIKANSSGMGNLSKAGITTNSWLNTLTFMKAWDMVLKDGRWWSHEWTAKVDPDAVFFPHRLKVRLYNYYKAGDLNGPALWVGNCDRSFRGRPKHLKLFGALEVFSRNALGMYNAHGDECKDQMDWEGWGEDFYMQECMKMMKVQSVNGVGFVGDARCYYAPCSDTTKVAFHDFKDAGSYFTCWDASRAAEASKTEVFMKK